EWVILEPSNAVRRCRAVTTRSDDIVRQLPSLRRYARVLAGNCPDGDDLVLRLIEALVAGPSPPGDTQSVRVDLFRRFSLLYNAAAATRDGGGAGRTGGEPATPLPVQAYLLYQLEAFSPEDAASVFCVPAERLATLVSAGAEAIRSLATGKVLILAVEPLL